MTEFEHNHDEPMSFTMKDAKGFTPDLNMIGSVWEHKTGKRYILTQFVWMGETDTWGLLLVERGAGVSICRALSYLITLTAIGDPTKAVDGDGEFAKRRAT